MWEGPLAQCGLTSFYRANTRWKCQEPARAHPLRVGRLPQPAAPTLHQDNHHPIHRGTPTYAMASSILLWIGDGNADGVAGAFAGRAAGVVAVPAAGMFVGQPGRLRLGMERCPAAPEPPTGWFGWPTT